MLYKEIQISWVKDDMLYFFFALFRLSDSINIEMQSYTDEVNIKHPSQLI